MAIKTKRLSKIAREFNVGISTIIEFLKKKGFDINSNPNTKVTPECYAVLVKEYSSEIYLKKESKKLGLLKNREKKETLSVNNLSDKVENKESDEENVILVKDTSHTLKETKEVSNSIVKDNKFKIVGKINLNELENKEKVKKDTSNLETISEKVVIDKLDKPVEEKKNNLVKEDVSKKEINVIEEPNELPKVEKKTIENKKEEKIKLKKKETLKKEEVKVEETKVEEAKTDETQKEQTKKDQISKDEISKDEINVSKTIKKSVSDNDDDKKSAKDFKVIGKIDLKSINQRTRPKKKTQKEKEEERRVNLKAKIESIHNKDKQQQQKQEKKKSINDHIIKKEQQKEGGKVNKNMQVVEKEAETLKKETIFQTKVKKLTGPTVVGKIELPTQQEKKKQSTPADKNKVVRRRKKRRKRIKKAPINLAKQQTTEKKTVTKTEGTKTPKKIELKTPRKKIRLTRGRFAKKNLRVQKKEVDEKDVQKQIKETLARLTSKKKNKGVRHRKEKRVEIEKKHQKELDKIEKEKTILKVTEFVSVNDLAGMMSVPVNNVISTCMNLGLLVSINQRLDADTIVLVAEEFGYKVEFVSVDVQKTVEEEQDKESDLKNRAPIVTVMGHVDHGKTSLLDYIRNTNVIAGEAGGITQHIGAYNLKLKNGQKITFLDTPGHEAFTAMRARGAKITDVVIVVVSADDSVMPQTIEAINHAQAANVPIVFAINKIDKEGANPDKIKEELANMNYLVESWGGKYQSKDISAKQGINIEELLELVLLEAEMLELKANPNKNAIGTVLESSLDKGRGYLAKVLVKAGTLKVGDVVLAGAFSGKIKAMFNERNQRIEIAGPSYPALILGLNGAPQAGDKLNVVNSEREARDIANKREQVLREQGLRAHKHITLDEIGRRIAIGNFKELNIIVKGDVDGSVEALSDALIRLSKDEIQINIIHKAVGQIAESDVTLATASNAIIIGFQVRPSHSARKLAEKEQIDIQQYSIIYDAINEIKSAMEGMLSPIIKEKINGTAEIREIFKITKVGTIGGCMVKEGKIFRKNKVRVIRDGIVIYTGELGSLKRFKDDVKDVSKGFECGLNIERFNDIKVGDMVESFQETEVRQILS